MPTPNTVAYYHNIDLVTNRILNVRLHPVTSAERVALGALLSTAEEGLVVYDKTIDTIYAWDGLGWVSIGGTGGDGQHQSDYDYNITGNRDGVNTVFTLSLNYKPGSTKVYVNGLRYTPGASYDYVETGPNQITFNTAPDPGDLIVVDYIKV